MFTSFEKSECSRCGGTGKHSFNLQHGDTCYGCFGSGMKYTKRGATACNFYLASLEMDVSDIKPGYFIKRDNRWLKVESMGKSTTVLSDGWTEFRFTNGTGLNIRTESGKLTCVKSDEHFKELRTKAFEYQATLTKAGKVMKKFIAA